MLSIVGCGRSSFEGLLQLIGLPLLVVVCCGRSSFEGLLQHVVIKEITFLGCGRSSFEGLLQQHSSWRYLVVESPVLRDYYNTGNGSKFEGTIPA